MSDTTALLLFTLLFIVIPSVVIIVPLFRYGRRHGWGPRQRSWATLVTGIGWFVVLFGWFVKWPINKVLTFAAILGGFCALLLIAMDWAEKRWGTPK